MYEYEHKANGKAICSNTYRNRNEKWVEKWIIEIRKIYNKTFLEKEKEDRLIWIEEIFLGKEK